MNSKELIKEKINLEKIIFTLILLSFLLTLNDAKYNHIRIENKNNIHELHTGCLTDITYFYFYFIFTFGFIMNIDILLNK